MKSSARLALILSPLLLIAGGAIFLKDAESTKASGSVRDSRKPTEDAAGSKRKIGQLLDRQNLPPVERIGLRQREGVTQRTALRSRAAANFPNSDSAPLQSPAPSPAVPLPRSAAEGERPRLEKDLADAVREMRSHRLPAVERIEMWQKFVADNQPVFAELRSLRKQEIISRGGSSTSQLPVGDGLTAQERIALLERNAASRKEKLQQRRQSLRDSLQP